MSERHIIPLGEYLKGKVSKVNPTFLYFELNQKYRIFMDIKTPVLQFPFENDEVEINCPKKFDIRTCTAVIGEGTVCLFPRVNIIEDPKSLGFLNFLRENNMNENDLIAVDFMLRKLELYVPEHALYNCLKILLENAPSNTIAMPDTLASNNEAPKCYEKVHVKNPHDLNYINDNSDLYTFVPFYGMCAYGVYPNNKYLEENTDLSSEFLFGILEIDPLYGCFRLRDNRSTILLKFFENNSDLYNFIDKVVLIKKWTVFTEMFQKENTLTLKYIILDISDVIIVASALANSFSDSRKKIFFNKNEVVDTLGTVNTVLIQINKISDTIWGYHGSPECWIEASLLRRNDRNLINKTLAYLIFCKEHLSVAPLLKENKCYLLHFKGELEFLNTYLFKELYGLRSARQMIKIYGDTKIQESNEAPVEQAGVFLRTFQEVKDFLRSSASSQQAFSFSLEISRKVLLQPIHKSHSVQRHRNFANFGSPVCGKQTQLTFFEPVSKSCIDLYLSNRENHVTPIGLLPSMRINAKHVLAQSNRYIKATVFTSFEMVEYCPSRAYSSASLSFSDVNSWRWQDVTPKTSLGKFIWLPQNCIVHGYFMFIALFDLKIASVCVTCKTPLLPNKNCRTCGPAGRRDVDVELCCLVQDLHKSAFKIETDNKYFLYALLGLNNDGEVEYFCESFRGIGLLKIDFCKLNEFDIAACTRDADSIYFVEELINCIKSINNKLYLLVEGVCVNQNNSFRPWRMVQFSLAENSQ